MIEPPFYRRNVAEVKGIVSQHLMPITVIGDRQYYISAKHGSVLHKDVSVPLTQVIFILHPYMRTTCCALLPLVVHCCFLVRTLLLRRPFHESIPLHEAYLLSPLLVLDADSEQALLWRMVGRTGWEAPINKGRGDGLFTKTSSTTASWIL